MKKLIIQIILAGIIIFLGYKCYESIKIPQQFKVIKEQRYARIADRLKDIRTAQEAYKGVYGKYTGSFDTLINFIKYDSVKVVRSIGSLSDEDLEKGITEEKILIVAGRGVKKKEDLEMLKELAGLVGGKLASSRALVEKGWMLPKEQIGLSGNTVSPDYMITCGVSGTVQFMAGMKNTKNIIAINEDPKARIFEIAHYPIVGDLYEIVPELIRIIKERRGDC